MWKVGWFGSCAMVVVSGWWGLQACSQVQSAPSMMPKGTVSSACQCDKGNLGKWTGWPTKPVKKAGSAFWKHWGDGKAELSGYKGKTPRYGQLRDAEAVMIFVTEPMNRDNWIKDDGATGTKRVNVLKLNYHLTFRTGMYPYSVLTSVFSPVDNWGKERFSPAKVSLSAQEWCGHVWLGLWPGQRRLLFEMKSYFAGEGEKKEVVNAPSGVLYEDGLLVQLRELEGSFHKGKNWSGSLVPSLWWQRVRHVPLRPLGATITRSEHKEGGMALTRFVLRYKGSTFSRTIDVEKAWPRRIVRLRSSEGEDLKLQKTARLAYWGLHNVGDGTYRKQLGL
jgi:hypothetical protein